MTKYSRITPEGTKDYLFEECSVRREVENTLAGVFLSHGFHEVVTPGLEFYDVFDPDFSGIGQEVMYKMTDRKGRLLVMRPDSTIPIARLAATRLQNLPKPIRLFYNQPIYRNHPGLTGRSNENVQTGVELLGADGFRADLETVSTAVEVLSQCIPDFRLELGHADFFRILSRQLPVSDESRENIRRAIGTKNYTVLHEMLSGINSPQARALMELPHLFGGEDVFERAAADCPRELIPTLDYLHRLYHALSEYGLGSRLIVDLGLVQRNDYYTGVVFSAYVENCGESVLLGGRYDHLAEHFGPSMPSIGFGVNVDAVSRAILAHRSDCRIEPAEVLIHGEDGYEVKALRYFSELMKKKVRCENSVFRTHREALAYANEAGIRKVDFVGSDIQTVLTGRKK